MKSVIDTIILFSMIAAIPSVLFYSDYRKNEKIRTSEIKEAVILEVSSYGKSILSYDKYRSVVLDMNKNGKFDKDDAIVHTSMFVSDEDVGKNAILVQHKYGIDFIAIDSDNGYIESCKMLNSYEKDSKFLNEKFREYINKSR